MLVSKNADVPGLVVGSIEGKPMHGHLALKPMLKGEQMTLIELHYEPGAKAPLHTHSHESLIYVVTGRVKTTIGNEDFVLGPGDVARHPQGVLHTVEALAESTVVEVKSPAPDVTSFVGTRGGPRIIASRGRWVARSSPSRKLLSGHRKSGVLW
jgi:quercetin dioxygenase-like cupin family protein